MDAAVTIARYKELLKTLNYAKGTIENYRYGLERFREWLEGREVRDLREVTKQTILDYKALVMSKTTHAVESKALLIRPVKRLFEHLTQNNLLLVNPTEGVIETHRREKKIGATLTREEMKKLLAVPNMSLNSGIRDRTIMEVLYATAMRIDELLTLEVHDVDLRDGVIFVRKAKGGRQRVVPLGKSAGAYLGEYLDKVRPRFGRKNPKVRRLFLNNKGEPMTYGNVRQNLYQCARSAKLGKPASPHVFRRSCATHMLKAGADIRYIQKILGHARLATTQQYCKVVPVDIKRTHEETHPNGREKRRLGNTSNTCKPATARLTR